MRRGQSDASAATSRGVVWCAGGDDIPVPQNRGWCIEQSACADRYGAYQVRCLASHAVHAADIRMQTCRRAY